MADKKVIGTQIKIEGDKEYKKSLQDIQKQAGLLKSEMKLVTSEFSNNANSIDALRRKQEVLDSQFENQKKKVDTLRDALERARREYGDNSDQVLNWQKKLNYAESDLNKLNDEVQKNEKYLKEAENSIDNTAKSIDEFGKEVKGAGEDLSKANDDVTSFGTVMKDNLASQAIIEGVKMLGRALKELGQYAINSVRESAAYADEILTLSTNTRIATDTLQELYYMQELTDVSLDTLTKTMARNIRSMGDAQRGTLKTKEAYERLGVSVTDSNGELRNSEEVYWEAIDALGAMANETRRDSTAMDLFGRSAQDLNSIIAIGSEGVEAYAKEARDMGAVLSDDVLETLGDADDAFQRMDQRLKIVKRQFGIAFAPAVTRGAERLTEALGGMTDDLADLGAKVIDKLVDSLIFLVDNIDVVIGAVKGMVTGFLAFKAVTIGASLVGSFIALKGAITAATIAQTGLNVAMSANPIGLIAAAIGLVVGGITLLSSAVDDGTDVVDEFVDKVDELNSKTQEMIDKSKEAFDQQKRSTEEIAIASDGYRNLADSIFDLSEKTNLNAGEQKLLGEMVAQLNEEVPDLNLLYDEQTGLLNLNRDAVYQLIEARRDELLAQAGAEALTETYKELANQQYEVSKRELERLELTKEVTRRQKEEDEALKNYNETMKRFKDGQAELMYDMGDLIVEYQNAKRATDEAKDAVKRYDQASRDTQGSISDLQAQEEYWRTYIVTNGDVDAATQAMLEYKTSILNSSVATEDLLKKTDTTVAGIAKKYANLPTKADLYNNMYKAGSNAVAGFEDGFNWRWKIFQPRLEASASDVEAKYKKVLQMRSPSKKMEQLGEYTGEGYEIGLVNSMKKAQTSLEKLMTSSVRSLGGVSSSVNVTQNAGGADYTSSLNAILNTLGQHQNMQANVVVNIAGKQLQYAMKNVDLAQTMRFSEV